MPVPKRKKSKSRKGTRRAHHAISTPSSGLCSRCKSPKMPHRVCNTCGFYNDKDVLRIEEQY